MSQKTIGIGLVMTLWFLTVGLAALQQQQTPAPAIEVDKLGPQVGAAVPDFSLPDQHGERRSLKSLMGPKGAILVFFRSADW